MNDDDDRTARVGEAAGAEALNVATDVASGEAGRFAAEHVATAVADLAGVATGGLARVGIAVARAALGPTADERVEREAQHVDRDAALRVPPLEREVAMTKAEVARISTALRQHIEADRRARSTAFEDEVVRLVASGALSAEDVEADAPLREAILESYRRAMETVSAAAIGPLARLSATYRGRPIDRTFRLIGRVLVDLNAAEIDALRVLARAGALIAPRVVRSAVSIARRVEEGRGVVVARGYLLHDQRSEGVSAIEERVNADPTVLHGLIDALVATGAATVDQGLAASYQGLPHADDDCVVPKPVLLTIDHVLSAR